ncbi:MAG: hypothetical protein WCJ07_15600, partial [Verrucomicrobiota bacterium]
MSAKFTNSFEFELPLWQSGIARVAGVDEAGRGPLAGPVVAAAAILPPRWAQSGLPAELAGLNDSKQLTEAQREQYFEFLTRCAEIEFAIAAVDAGVIDEINILQATHRAMNDALARLHTVDWRGLGLGDFGKPEQFIARQLALWTRQYESARTET